MSDNKKFEGKTGVNHMSQMQKFKESGPTANPLETGNIAQPQDPTNPIPVPDQGQVTQQDPSNPKPPGQPEPTPQPVAEPKGNETFEFKGVVNRPSNQPLPTKAGEEPKVKEEEPTPEPVTEPKEGEPISQDPAPEPTPEPTAEPISVTDEVVSNYLKEKFGKEDLVLEDLFKPTADPLDGLDDTTKGFIKFNKETGRPYNEYVELNKDWSKIDPVDVARQQAIEKSKGALDRSSVDEYLEGKLNITSLSELDRNDRAELNIYNADFIEKKTAEKNKYHTPTEAKQKQIEQANTEMVTLENGAIIPKSKFIELQEEQRNYIKALKDTSDKITGSNFKVSYDDNGNKLEFELAYDYSKDEKHRMVENSTDIIATLKKQFGTKNGVDLKGVQEAAFWMIPENREKAFNAVASKAIAAFAREIAKVKTNPTYTQTRMPSGSTSTQKSVENPFIRGQVKSGIKFPKELFRQ